MVISISAVAPTNAEILRFAQNDKRDDCHPEQSEGSLLGVTYNIH